MSYTENEIDFLKRQLENAEHYQLGYKRAKETLYTEEEVREGIRMCFASTSAGNLITIDDVIRYIKSLKQK
jgi:hypothetical protein